jgi:type I restriction enzyme M protein
MPKSLGSKRRQISADHMAKIVAMVRDRAPGPHVKLFQNTDFGYREIRVLRPLRLRFHVNAERRARLFREKAIDRLEGKQKQGLAEAVASLEGKAFASRDEFRNALERSLASHGAPRTNVVVKTVEKHFGERDPDAPVCTNAGGRPEADAELTDFERVPLSESIEAYFDREVKPHAPDAWIDQTYCDDKDRGVGTVGYEISFNRHFYVFTPPRPLAEIDADLKGVTERILKMLGELKA